MKCKRTWRGLQPANQLTKQNVAHLTRFGADSMTDSSSPLPEPPIIDAGNLLEPAEAA